MQFSTLLQISLFSVAATNAATVNYNTTHGTTLVQRARPSAAPGLNGTNYKNETSHSYENHYKNGTNNATHVPSGSAPVGGAGVPSAGTQIKRDLGNEHQKNGTLFKGNQNGTHHKGNHSNGTHHGKPHKGAGLV